MPNTDFRMAVGITAANRALRAFAKPKPSNIHARHGLQYENKVGKELNLHLGKERFLRLEHNPWFTFTDTYGTSDCCPDFILWLDRGAIIIEVKLTWVDVALTKLHELYCPVISIALDTHVLPLVICRNITPFAPAPKFSLSEALSSPNKLLQWSSSGHIQW